MKKQTHNYQLDPEEKQLVADIESGNYRSIPYLEEEKKRYQSYARSSQELRAENRKDKNINIRISSGDIEKIQERAIQNGLPYHTLISTVLHQFANGKIEVKL
ncbi:antitoxin [Candidatus Roizmanbacteria bacterium]|nr:antitoxin [Candidatus Roizmanbacteria bacterium]